MSTHINRTNNNGCDYFVGKKLQFQGSNLYGVWHNGTNRYHVSAHSHRELDGDRFGDGLLLERRELVPVLYVVFSYGSHFPLAVYDLHTDEWLVNADHYSSSTARHKSYAVHRCRDLDNAERKSTEHLQAIILAGGTVNAVAQRMDEGAPA